MKKTKKTALTAAAFAAAMGANVCSSLPVSSFGDLYYGLRISSAGDIDGDGELDLTDVIFLYKYLTNKQPMTEEEYYRADVNEDGYVNIFDFVMQKQILLFVPVVPVPLYGPPPEEDTTYNPETDTIPETVYGPPVWMTDLTETETYDPETDIPICVYGPPEYFETDQTEPETTTYVPESDLPVCVYGPPEYFETTEPETDTTYNPEDEEPQDVYGPPEYFGTTEN